MIDGPFNPLDTENIAKSICSELASGIAIPLSAGLERMGSGIYALYYIGDFEPYRQISCMNRSEQFLRPIYIGKAVPRGARKGYAHGAKCLDNALSRRLSNHYQTLEQVENLSASDFYYRSLRLDSIWASVGETVAIEKWQPLWNTVIDGFGNKTPGKGRSAQERSAWDMLHPGRHFVKNLKLPKNSSSYESLRDRVISSLCKESLS